MENEIIEKVDKLYDECKDIFTPYVSMNFNYSKIKDENKMKFFVCLSDYFLQMRQKEAIKNEKY